jgi:hypothetical protein
VIIAKNPTVPPMLVSLQREVIAKATELYHHPNVENGRHVATHCLFYFLLFFIISNDLVLFVAEYMINYVIKFKFLISKT